MRRSLVRPPLALFACATLATVGCSEKKAEAPADKPVAQKAAPAAAPESAPAAAPKAAPESAPAAAPAKAASPRNPSVTGEEVTYESKGVKLKGYIAWDTSTTEPRPGVLVVHEWWGHTEYVRKRAEQLAAMGYTAFALDMYGDGKTAGHPDDAKKFMMEVLGNMEAGANRFVAARQLLEKHSSTDPAKTAAIGYCFGGAIVLHMARQGMDLKGVASFHGNLSTQAPAKKGAVKAKMLVAHGEADPFVPAEQVDAFKKEMTAAGADLEFVAYPGAKHAFTNPAADENGKKFNLPLAYDEDADQKSWKRLEGFLAEVFAR